LESLVRVMDAGAHEQSSVCHDGRLFVTHILCLSAVRNLFAVNLQRKLIDVVMAKFVGVRVYAAEKIGVLYHGK
jgi:hypothetical protein